MITIRKAADRGRFDFYELGKPQPAVTVQAERKPGVDELTLQHVQNFLECVKSRQRPNGDVLIGHRSAQASHLF